MIPPLYDGSPKDTMCASVLYAATVYAARPLQATSAPSIATSVALGISVVTHHEFYRTVIISNDMYDFFERAALFSIGDTDITKPIPLHLTFPLPVCTSTEENYLRQTETWIVISVLFNVYAQYSACYNVSELQRV